MPRRAELPNLHPARLDLAHYRGDSLSAIIRLRSQGVPIDVTKWDMLSYIRTSADGPLIAQFSVLKEGDGIDGAQGIIRLWLPYQSARLLPDSCVWDLEVTQTDAAENPFRVTTILRGYIYTTGDVTYPELIDEEIPI